MFTTCDSAKLELVFPKFSSSKAVRFEPDVIYLPENGPDPHYDLIIGMASLAKLNVVLDFNQRTLTMDGLTTPMRTKSDMDRECNNLYEQFKQVLEPSRAREQVDCVKEILDAVYEKADLPRVVHEQCDHLSPEEKNKLLQMLSEFEELFDGTLGDWNTTPVSLELKEGTTPFHAKRAFPIPRVYLEVLKKEVARLVELGVLKRQPDSEWAVPTFVIPKKDKTVRFISDLREVNKRIVRKPYPIPKISSVLQEMEGFTYASQLDLNMGYYTIRLDGDAQKICTIILPWGKYSYLRLPMGLANAPDIFQEKMAGLTEHLEFVKAYIDDL